MSETNGAKEEELEIRSNLSKSSESKKAKKTRKTKTKVERILGIINSDSDDDKNAKEQIIDFDSSYRISLNLATNYNQSLLHSRKQFQNHFLKKRVKAAFEREPLEKNKGFFNVPFIPSLSLFQSPPPMTTIVPNVVGQDKKFVTNQVPNQGSSGMRPPPNMQRPQMYSNNQNITYNIKPTDNFQLSKQSNGNRLFETTIKDERNLSMDSASRDVFNLHKPKSNEGVPMGISTNSSIGSNPVNSTYQSKDFKLQNMTSMQSSQSSNQSHQNNNPNFNPNAYNHSQSQHHPIHIDKEKYREIILKQIKTQQHIMSKLSEKYANEPHRLKEDPEFIELIKFQTKTKQLSQEWGIEIGTSSSSSHNSHSNQHHNRQQLGQRRTDIPAQTTPVDQPKQVVSSVVDTDSFFN